ncbi:hypothetical protein MPH_14100 [Macrophomina phaseolina MS6]|uniref:ribonuclease H n=1 Tax=Macrophomina phaseolina (strain MS6) TaxID=1126212 RepID=K2R410_MACPH|nr:hypothetical protein MPH_14100 [Macrophomina phaseolina MS6]
MRQAQEVNLDGLETIEPFGKHPWQDNPAVTIEHSDTASSEASNPPRSQVSIFTDGSARNGRVGIGIYCTGGASATVIEHSETLGSSEKIDNHLAELEAIRQAVALIDQAWPQREIIARPIAARVKHVIYCDSKSALQSLLRPRQRSGQVVLKQILETLDKMQRRKVPVVQLRWVPAHAGVPGNERANKLALQATEPDKALPDSGVRLKSVALADVKRAISRAWAKELDGIKEGRLARTLDRALSQNHTRKLYDKLNAAEAAVIAQLRTSRSRLNESLHKIRRVDSSRCACGRGEETAKHFLLECTRWSEQRAELQRAVGKRFGDISYMLGGWSGTKRPDGTYLDGPAERWKADIATVKATAAFAIATGRLRAVIE